MEPPLTHYTRHPYTSLIAGHALRRIGILFLSIYSVGDALILYDGDNARNLTAPDAQRTEAFNSVGRVANAITGSVTHVRGKYCITANHVNLSPGSVSFDGITNYTIDPQFPIQKIGDADMKLLKLIDDPGLPETVLNTSFTADLSNGAFFVGWGVGRAPDIQDSSAGPVNTWTWGSGGTLAKRWGTNDVEGSFPANSPGLNLPYESLFTRANGGFLADPDEAAAAIFDSGSGLFVEDNGQWVLAGLTTAVQTSNSSRFGQPTDGDLNFFVRIAAFASAIEAEIPDLTTYTGWTIDHSLYGADALEASDTDDDGLTQLEEFALGSDPRKASFAANPTQHLVEDSGNRFLELVVTRPVGLQGVDYLPETTTDLTLWPGSPSGFVSASPTPVDNGDGTETLVYRVAQPVSSSIDCYIRLVIVATQ